MCFNPYTKGQCGQLILLCTVFNIFFRISFLLSNLCLFATLSSPVSTPVYWNSRAFVLFLDVSVDMVSYSAWDSQGSSYYLPALQLLAKNHNRTPFSPPAPALFIAEWGLYANSNSESESFQLNFARDLISQVCVCIYTQQTFFRHKIKQILVVVTIRRQVHTQLGSN